MIYLGFLFCATIIFFAGKKLSYYGDLLAEVSGLGKAWIGLILMSAVTSLPELMVGISSVTFVNSADLATGDIIGSCALNLGILCLMDSLTPKKNPLFSKISNSHILAASLGIILLCLVGLGLYFDHDYSLLPSIGITSLSFCIVYLISVRTIYQFQKKNKSEKGEDSNHTIELSKGKIIIMYSIFAIIIILAALALPYFAEHIAEDTGLGKSFVGTLFLAVSTSLPEIAVSISAIKLGAEDMAVGNLLGSNIFNVFILFIDDLFYTKGHLLIDSSNINLMSVFLVIIMSVLAIISILFRNKEKRFNLDWGTLMIFFVYILNVVLLYKLS